MNRNNACLVQAKTAEEWRSCLERARSLSCLFISSHFNGLHGFRVLLEQGEGMSCGCHETCAVG